MNATVLLGLALSHIVFRSLRDAGCTNGQNTISRFRISIAERKPTRMKSTIRAPQYEELRLQM